MNLLLLALVPACFALNPVIGRALADQFGPATLSVVRWALSSLWSPFSWAGGAMSSVGAHRRA
jgi:hypothetical protein